MQNSQRISTKVIIGASAALLTLMAQQGGAPKPTCNRCSATYIPVSELNAYTAKAIKYNLVDQQVGSVEAARRAASAGVMSYRTGNRDWWPGGG